MTSRPLQRVLWLGVTAGLVLLLFWLDQNRTGPASLMSRCNLALSRSPESAADVLIVGSSRSGTALDPIAMQQMLAHATAGGAPTVVRFALGHSPLRASHALLQNYLEERGAPKILVLEIMFLTQRSVGRLARARSSLPPEQYIFRRDVNLMKFEQILRLPDVAMPFSEDEGWLNRWRFRIRGIVLRASALAYQFMRHPDEAWHLSACDRNAWTREPEWPREFAFSYGDFAPDAPPGELIESLETTMARIAPQRSLKKWQFGVDQGQRYPYDFTAAYREGEVALLESMLALAEHHGTRVVLLPMSLYGFAPDAEDLRSLSDVLTDRAHVFDLYGQVRPDLAKFWYDDGHLEPYPAGALTTAVLAQH